LLSAILKEATQINTCEFTYSNLMTELNITVEHWGKDPQGYYSGGYNFYITPRELAQFGLLYLNNGMYMSKQIIPKSWVDLSLSVQVSKNYEYDYSYGWWVTRIANKNVYKAWGYGGQYICLIPELDILIVSTANSNGIYNEFNLDNFVEQYVLPAVQ
jgi:CubicO group peptidase (beta-lactamase class C family)